MISTNHCMTCKRTNVLMSIHNTYVKAGEIVHSYICRECRRLRYKRGKENARTVNGGKRAAITIKERYGENFYKEIGAIGGKKSKYGGFYANRELARTAGAKGGKISRKKKIVLA